MLKSKIFRKRYIPNEIVDISGDEILFKDDQLLITKWNTIKPKKEFAKGISFTFINENYKISRFYNDKLEFLFWYCDIINCVYDELKDEYLITDLILDIKVMPNNDFFILDKNELIHAINENIISEEEVIKANTALNKLIKMIKNNQFPPKICTDKKYVNNNII